MRATILALLIGISAYFFLPKNKAYILPQAQQDTVDALGYPHQFVISYMPSVGTNDKKQSLVRNEIWYYPKQQIKIHFLAGKVFSVDQYNKNNLNNLVPTKYKPEQFHFDQDYEEVAKLLEEEPTPLDFFDLIIDEDSKSEEHLNARSYASRNVFFMIEHEHLTYLQTYAMVENPDEN